MLMFRMMGRGKVIGVEPNAELREMAKECISISHKGLLDDGSIELVDADPKEGYTKHAPYSFIHCPSRKPDKSCTPYSL